MVVASETHMNAAPSSRIHEYIRAAGGRRDDYTMFDAGIYTVGSAGLHWRARWVGYADYTAVQRGHLVYGLPRGARATFAMDGSRTYAGAVALRRTDAGGEDDALKVQRGYLECGLPRGTRTTFAMDGSRTCAGAVAVETNAGGGGRALQKPCFFSSGVS